MNDKPRLVHFGDDVAPAPEVGTITRPAARHVVRTGPSGLLLGQGVAGPVSIRLFRPRPTRLMLSVRDYVPWLLAFRSVSLGAHLSVIASQPGNWPRLVDVVRRCGGTADIIDSRGPLPSQGRSYRPSLLIDADRDFDGASARLGAWQALMIAEDASSSGAVHSLRDSDMAIVGPVDVKAAENLRRAYALNASQVRLMANLGPDEVVLVMPRRIVRVSVPPTRTESALLFS